MLIAGKMCIYTNENVTFEELGSHGDYLPNQSVDEEPVLDELTPREIVRELDKHVVGQAMPSAPWPSPAQPHPPPETVAGNGR